jgi:hypothetical protein
LTALQVNIPSQDFGKTAEFSVTRPLLENVCINSTSDLVGADWLQEKLEHQRAFNRQTAAVLAHRGYREEAGKLSDCGAVLRSDICGTCHDTSGKVTVGQVYLNHCHQYRLCPICAGLQRRGEIDFLNKCAELINKRPIAGYRWRKIILTIKTDGKYLEAVDKATGGFKKIWRSLLKHKYSAIYKNGEFGSVNGNFHDHLVAYIPFIAQSELSEVWEKATGSGVVWIEKINNEQELKEAINEQAKYITKFGDASPEMIVDIWEALSSAVNDKGKKRSVRLSACYGMFRRNVLEKRLEVEAPKKGRAAEKTEKPDLGICLCCGDRNWIAIYPPPEEHTRILDKIPERRFP